MAEKRILWTVTQRLRWDILRLPFDVLLFVSSAVVDSHV